MVEYINTPVTRLGNSSSKNCLKYNRITNCITEIPQDIYVEKTSTHLVLKEGSKVWFCNGKDSNGNNKFRSEIISQDVFRLLTQINIGQLLSYNSQDVGIGAIFNKNIIFSNSKPSTNTWWYDTANNYLYNVDSSGNLQERSLPFAVCTSNKKDIQIFNGFGYIGSRPFILPGVKGLSPDGRNPDGTLRSKIIESKDFYLFNSNLDSYTRYLYMTSSGSIVPNIIQYSYFQDEEPTAQEGNVYWISEKDNLIRYTNNQGQTWTKYNFILCGKFFIDTDGIYSMNCYEPISLLDRNDTQFIASQAYPSNKYIDLTLGASGTYYTAPANGYFILAWHGDNSTDSYVSLLVDSYEVDHHENTGNYATNLIPILKGKSVGIYYRNIVVRYFRFIYSQGNS